MAVNVGTRGTNSTTTNNILPSDTVTVLWPGCDSSKTSVNGCFKLYFQVNAVISSAVPTGQVPCRLYYYLIEFYCSTHFCGAPNAEAAARPRI